jgi:hypothetical protein
MKGYIDIEMDEKLVMQAVAFGHMKFNEKDGVYDLTAKGQAWIDQWLTEKLAEKS